MNLKLANGKTFQDWKKLIIFFFEKMPRVLINNFVVLNEEGEIAKVVFTI